uniref:Conserved oligomeric Golgi complex subunit 7 n=1 Tax=Globodera pallida TaxID=36090 RepID=A0A183BKL5_GLOPA
MNSVDDEKLTQILTAKLAERKFDEINLLNTRELSGSHKQAYRLVCSILRQCKEAYSRDRSSLSMPITIDQTSQLGSNVDTLNKRLQEHLRMLRQNESSTKQPNAVLEYDMAKRKVDKLAELLRAKLLWFNTCQELQLLDASDGAMRYQKLYSLGDEKVSAFEKLKDEFLSWYSPATILAIDTGDVKHLDSIKEKYYSLDRIKVFESNFGNYAKNKIKSFIEDESKENTLWSILQEFFAIWKRTQKLTDSLIQEDGSEVISKSLFDGLLSKWEVIVAIVSDLVSSSETPFVAAKSLGKVLADFSDFVQKEGDEHIMAVFSQIMHRVFSVFSDDYGKYATSVILCVVNKITAPEKGSRHRHKFNWLLPFLEEIQSEMRDIVKQSAITFGAEFSSKIVPSFEHGLRELNSLLQNHDILNIKPEGIDIRTRKSIQENTEDKVSAICVMGYLLNIIDNVNEYISETTIDVGGVGTDSGESPRLISNASLLETLNLRVVGRKIESIANTITLTMEEEMHKLKQLEAEASEAMSLDEQLSRSLPSFSVAPHNYVTGVGHGLLSQMSTIGGYSNDRNFVRSISAAASDINSSFNADLWLLTEVAKLVQNVFCAQVGNVSQLSVKLRRQFNADILFLMEALADLRLQPTTQMSKLAEKLRENS